jgi:hypothetical protein
VQSDVGWLQPHRLPPPAPVCKAQPVVANANVMIAESSRDFIVSNPFESGSVPDGYLKLCQNGFVYWGDFS